MENANAITPLAPRTAVTALVAASFLLVTGCSQRSMADLEDYVKTARAAQPPIVEELCSQIECDVGTPFPVYTGANKRDPFMPFKVTDVPPPVPTPHPYPHPAEELEQYSLDSLRMIGTVDRDSQRWALVRSPDGIVHRVQRGNYLGKNNGRVNEIEEHRIAVNEIVWTANGWQDRKASLTLTEG